MPIKCLQGTQINGVLAFLRWYLDSQGRGRRLRLPPMRLGKQGQLMQPCWCLNNILTLYPRVRTPRLPWTHSSMRATEALQLCSILKEERKARGEQGKVEQGAAVGTNSKSQLQPGEAPPFLQEANNRHEATLGQTTLVFFLLIHSEGNIEGVASAWSSGSVSCQISSFISGKNRESRQSQERGSQEGEKVNLTVLVNCAIQVRSLLCFVTQFPLTWVTSTADVSIFPSTSLSAGVGTQ